jgi:outer membrane autotransporter protein
LLFAVAAWLVPLALHAQSLTIVSGNSQSLVPNEPSQPLVVQARDSTGAPLAGAAIAWSSPNATASFVNSGSTKTDSSGQSANRLIAVLPGNYTVVAQLVQATAGASVTFTFSNGVANRGALTPVQTSVAHAIDVACPALATSTTPITSKQTDFLNRCSEIVVGAGNSDIPNALEAMANNKTQPQSQMSNNIQASQATNLTARMTALRMGATGVSLGGLGFSDGGKGMSLAMLGDVFRKDPGDTQVGSDFARWGFFANGMVTRGGFSANESRPGFDYNGASITAGVDYRFNDSFVAGLALGYNKDSSDLDLDAGRLDVDGYSVNGYFVWYHANDFYLQGSLEYNNLNFDLRRNIIYQIAAIDGSGGTTSINQTAKASPGGNQESFELTLGRDFYSGALQVSPYLRGTWSHLSLDGFTESIDSSAPGFGLATQVDSRSRTNELATLGALFSYTASQNWGVLVPNARAEWSHDFKTDPQIVVSRFVSDPTQTEIVVSDPRLDHNFYELGLGLNALWPEGRSGYIAYEYVGGLTGGHLNRFELGFRIEF